MKGTLSLAVLCVIVSAALVFGAKLTYTGVNEAGAEFNTNPWVYPVPASYEHLQTIGMNVFRVPFLWERLQPSLSSTTFDSTERTKLVNSITDITKNGAYAIVDPHNYARYQGNVIGSSGGPTNAQFQAFWQALASLFVNNPRVIFGVMNEPHDMSTEQWLSASNAGIAGIRASGATQLILVPGNGYTGGHSWTANWYGTPNSQVMGRTVDSGNNFAFEVHQYFDGDYSGVNSGCKSETVGPDVMPPLTNWARSSGYKVFVGEFGAGNDPTCQKCIVNFLDYLQANSDVYIGFTWWSAGPNWPADYFTLLEPINGQDRPQAVWLAPYLSGPKTANVTVYSGGNAGSSNTPAVYIDSFQGTWSPVNTWAKTWSSSNTGQYTYPNANSGNSISWVPSSYDAIYITCTSDGNSACFDNTFASISFYINGGASGGQISIRVQLRDTGKNPTGNTFVFTTQANSWVYQSIPLSTFGATGPFIGFTIQENLGQSPGQTIYIDNIYVNPTSSNNPSPSSATAASNSNTNTATRSPAVAASNSGSTTNTATRSTAASLSSTNTASRSLGASLSISTTNTASLSRPASISISSTTTASRSIGASLSASRSANSMPSLTSAPSTNPGSSPTASPNPNTGVVLTQAIYIDQLQNNWQFSVQPNLFNQQASSPTYGNSQASLSYTPTGNSNDRLVFACYNQMCLNSSFSYGIQFQVNAGTGSKQSFTIQLTSNNNPVGNVLNFDVTAKSWKTMQFNYNQFGSFGNNPFLNGFIIQGVVGAAQSTTFFDSFYVIGGNVNGKVKYNGGNKKRIGQDMKANNTADAIGVSRDAANSWDDMMVELTGLTEEQYGNAENVDGWLAAFNAAQGSNYMRNQVEVSRMVDESSTSESQNFGGAASSLSGLFVHLMRIVF